MHPIPSARSGQDHSGGPSATPIYDALYAEYVKSFRALPGDRRGEENLAFTAFGYLSQSARHVSGQQPTWQRVGTIGQHHSTGMHHIPALPPGPRRGI